MGVLYHIICDTYLLASNAHPAACTPPLSLSFSLSGEQSRRSKASEGAVRIILFTLFFFLVLPQDYRILLITRSLASWCQKHSYATLSQIEHEFSFVNTLRTLFGQKLRQLRRNKHISQEQLAEALGLTVEFVSLMERGINAPSFETLEKLATVLNLPVKDLFDF
jgi:DNA-binding XRE family transcriptional regulator